MTDYDDNHDADQEPPSKSERKRQMHALQDLGTALVALSERQLERIPVEDARLLQAIAECRGMRSHSARRRHLQLIGKLMRDIDPEPIREALERLHKPQRDATAALHELEALRDELLGAGPAAVERVVTRWPGADRQQLRQLVLQHQREVAQGKPPAASRKLFRYLRELQETYGSSD